MLRQGPEAPFGFRSAHALPERPLDRSGFPEGAAGIALAIALYAYATGKPSATSGDGALPPT
ncbi:hypothetical protein ACH4A3_28090 [Streptomyces sp. NPDC018007]|uniref:hypothetical protein n=1 Tax=Streptomyces sp. NPDC018007 TaxID=3365029 RepID=UPI003794B73E